MIKLGLTFIVLLIGALNLYGQKASEYYPLINKAEKHLINGELDSAIVYYNDAFVRFDYPFYGHLKQAAIVAYYSGDTRVLKKYLGKCVERGMNRKELEFFLVGNEADSSILEILKNYELYRKSYGAGIDSAMLMGFLEMDVVDRGINGISYSKGGHSPKAERRQDSLYIILVSRYIALVNYIGYPTERNVGLDRIIHNERITPFNAEWANSFRFVVSANADLLLDKENAKNWTNENSGVNRHEGSRPGNSFLFHLLIRATEFNDTAFLNMLNVGFNNLVVNPVTIMHYLEFKSWKQTTVDNVEVFDCGCSYWSKAFVQKAHRIENMMNLPGEVKARINDCRAGYYMRTIEDEQKIFERLFRLEYGKDPRKYNSRSVKKISFTYNSFM